MTSNKDLLRKEAIERRSKLQPQEIIEKSKIIMEKLLRLNQFEHADIIMSYINTDNEVKTISYMDKWILQGKKVCIPRIYDNEIQSCQIFNTETDLQYGRFNILEPKNDNTNIIDPKSIKLVIVPCVACDIEYNRIGYGKGYYDKFLSKLNDKCLKIGLVFECQLFKKIISDQNDIKMNIIITEEKII